MIRKVPDADLSSAGDDFHILWAIKKSLELLNFDSEGLKAITIEDFEKNISKKIDPSGENFLGIDLTEFYGGNDFESAESIIISQLKYSTRRATAVSYTHLDVYKRQGELGPATTKGRRRNSSGPNWTIAWSVLAG